MESSLRTVNNLLERLHASFFFYMLTGPDGFIVIGEYLTSAVLVGIGLELNGLQRWVASGWLQTQAGSAWRRASRPTLTALAIMIATQLVGLLFSVLIAGGFIFHGCNVWNLVAPDYLGLTAVIHVVDIEESFSYFRDHMGGALSRRLHFSSFGRLQWEDRFVRSHILHTVHRWHCCLPRLSVEF
jgi:hypothetical protein